MVSFSIFLLNVLFSERLSKTPKQTLVAEIQAPIWASQNGCQPCYLGGGMGGHYCCELVTEDVCHPDYYGRDNE